MLGVLSDGLTAYHTVRKPVIYGHAGCHAVPVCTELDLMWACWVTHAGMAAVPAALHARHPFLKTQQDLQTPAPEG